MARLVNVKTMFSSKYRSTKKSSSFEDFRRTQPYESATRKIWCRDIPNFSRDSFQTILTVYEISADCYNIHGLTAVHYFNCLVEPRLRINLGRSDHPLNAPHSLLHEPASCKSPAAGYPNITASPLLSLMTQQPWSQRHDSEVS